MLTNIIDSVGKTLLSDNSGKVWCKTECDKNLCVTTLYINNIPSEICSVKDCDTVIWQSVSLSEEDATTCKNALTTLIFSGYSDPSNWFVSLDLDDLISVFSKDMHFCEFKIDSEMARSITQLYSALEINKKAFIYLRASVDTLKDYISPDSVLTSSITDKKNVESFVQYSVDNTVPLGNATIDVWYC